jgi:cytoskeleton-associated protein 5
MSSANEKETYELAEQLLFRLLTDNLDKLGDNKEGDVILKTLNAAMLRLLENCHPSNIYCALFNLLRKYKEYTVLPKLPGLVIKCLLKLTKIIEKQTSQLSIDKLLLVIHEYMLAINHDEKS